MSSREYMREYMRKCRAAEYAARPDDWTDGRRNPDGPDPTAVARGVRKWRERHPERARAQYRLNKAVQRGTITRPDKCQCCGRTCKPHGHHTDYSKPLDVQWVCVDCHHAIHGGKA